MAQRPPKTSMLMLLTHRGAVGDSVKNDTSWVSIRRDDQRLDEFSQSLFLLVQQRPTEWSQNTHRPQGAAGPPAGPHSSEVWSASGLWGSIWSCVLLLFLEFETNPTVLTFPAIYLCPDDVLVQSTVKLLSVNYTPDFNHIYTVSC